MSEKKTSFIACFLFPLQDGEAASISSPHGCCFCCVYNGASDDEEEERKGGGFHLP